MPSRKNHAGKNRQGTFKTHDFQIVEGSPTEAALLNQSASRHAISRKYTELQRKMAQMDAFHDRALTQARRALRVKLAKEHAVEVSTLQDRIAKLQQTHSIMTAEHAKLNGAYCAVVAERDNLKVMLTAPSAVPSNQTLVDLEVRLSNLEKQHREVVVERDALKVSLDHVKSALDTTVNTTAASSTPSYGIHVID